MLPSRTLMVPLAAVVGAALIDGAIASGAGLFSHAWTAWLIVGGVAGLVIATIVPQIEAAWDVDDPAAEAHFAYVNAQTLLIATSLMIVGTAIILGACAPAKLFGAPPDELKAFAVWAGFVIGLMGFILAVARSTVGARAVAAPFPRATLTEEAKL